MASPHFMCSLLRPQLWLVLLLQAGGALVAADIPSYKGNGEPLHPTAITTKHSDKVVPVVAAIQQKARIEVDGQVIDAPSTAGFTFVRMPSFARGSVSITSHEIVQQGGRNVDGSMIVDKESTDEYRATLVADTAYDDAFLVVVVFDREFLTGEVANANTAVFFKGLGALQPNVPTNVVVNLGKFSPAARERMQYFPLVFSGGEEVRTQLCELSAAYFRRQELVRHVQMVSRFLQSNPEADRAIQPYVQISPILPAKAPGSVPTTISARLMINEEGFVTQADVQGEVPAPFKTELERALRGWLFFPQLVKGKPVATKAKVPIQVSLPPR